MKKIILLLTTFILSAHAINCIDIQFNTLHFADFSNYTLDSIVSVNGNKSESWYATYSFHRDENHVIDSVTDSEGNTQYSLISKSGSDNATIIDSYIDDSFESTSTFYKDKDSTYNVFYWYWNEEHEQDTSNVSILYLHNDTLYFESYDYTHGEKKLNTKKYTIIDSSSNKCYMYYTTWWGNSYDGEGKESGVSWIEEDEKSLVLYEINKVQFDSTYVEKHFYSKNKDGLTNILRKAKPSRINKQIQYFDLKGRPAKSKHSFRFFK